VKGDRRKLQLESLLLRAVQERLARGLSDPRVRGLVTATRLELTEDLKRAKVFISVMPAEHAGLTMHGLKAATPRIRRDVMEKVHLREMPALVFVYDEGLKLQHEVVALLAKDRQDREARGLPDRPAGSDPAPAETEPPRPEDDA
jgi:ribosome-binding factor A